MRRLLSWLAWRLNGRGFFDRVPGRPAAWVWRWRVKVVDITSWPASVNQAVLVLRAPQTRLARGAIGALARLLVEDGADFAYCDHGVLDEGKQQDFRKPQWSPQLSLAGPYPGPLLAVRRELFARAAGSAQSPHELILALGQEAKSVLRVPSVWAVTESTFGIPADPDGVGRTLISHNRKATVAQRSDTASFVEIRLVPARSLDVTAVIPTRDRGPMVEGLVRALAERTLHGVLRFVVVDNDSIDPVTLETLVQLELRADTKVVRAPGPFNFSRVCNIGLAEVTTELTLLLNDDVTPLHALWLDQLIADLDDPAIGVVGPLLLFPDGTIQHAGLVLGLGGVAGHAFRGSFPSDDGYFGMALARREVSAVSAACLLARTRDLSAIGGFDESLPVDFQDVDLCLRIKRDLGLATLIDPLYPLVHLESFSRGRRDSRPEDADTMRSRWGEIIDDDPYYSPRLPRVNPGYVWRSTNSATSGS